jgi:hypothetical protein
MSTKQTAFSSEWTDAPCRLKWSALRLKSWPHSQNWLDANNKTKLLVAVTWTARKIHPEDGNWSFFRNVGRAVDIITVQLKQDIYYIKDTLIISLLLLLLLLLYCKNTFPASQKETEVMSECWCVNVVCIEKKVMTLVQMVESMVKTSVHIILGAYPWQERR